MKMIKYCCFVIEWLEYSTIQYIYLHIYFLISKRARDGTQPRSYYQIIKQVIFVNGKPVKNCTSINYI